MADINLPLIFEDIGATEFCEEFDEFDCLPPAETPSVVENVSLSIVEALANELFVAEFVGIIEDIEVNFPKIDVDVVDNIIVTESPLVAPDFHDMDVFDVITLSTDFITLAVTPHFVSAVDVIEITEFTQTPIILPTDVNIDNISVAESVTMSKDIQFSDILRSYPFLTDIATGLVFAEFDSGVVQERDTWGRNKRTFTINFPPLSIAEAIDYEQFFESHVGRIFDFVHPYNGITYTVRIVTEQLRMERRAFSTFFGRLVVEEAF